jgi:DNA-binding HxlR family transcriptional regulator
MDANCSINKTADLIGKRWTILIILELYKGKNLKKRYSELKKKLPGITAKILSLRLKELEKYKLISKKIDSKNFQIKSEYSLTKEGLEFIKVIESIKQWSLNNCFKNPNCKKTDCKNCGL